MPPCILVLRWNDALLYHLPSAAGLKLCTGDAWQRHRDAYVLWGAVVRESSEIRRGSDDWTRDVPRNFLEEFHGRSSGINGIF